MRKTDDKPSKSAKSALLGSTAPPPPPQRPHTEAPSQPAAPIAATSRPHTRARRRAPHRHDSNDERGDDGEGGGGDDDDGGGGDDDDGPPKRRDHHGDRRLPPPPTFSLAELPDDCLLTEREVAAIGRWAVSTVQTWRRRGHPLKWVHVGNGFIRYRAADLREFLSGGSPQCPAQRTKVAETSQDAASARCRASCAPARAEAGADEIPLKAAEEDSHEH